MFTFKPFREEHLSLFRQWLNQPHVKEFWQETEDDEKLKTKFITELPNRGVHSYIIQLDGKNIGYIQYYNTQKVGGGWWENEKPGTFGVDLLIGDPAYVGKGLGSKIIKEFIAFMKAEEKSIQSFIIDPDPKNKRAIRAYEKVGFVSEGEIITPGGKALLMRMKV